MSGGRGSSSLVRRTSDASKKELFLIMSETGLLSFNKFIKYLASMGQMIVFSRLHIGGDKIQKPTGDIDIGSEGVQAVASLF